MRGNGTAEAETNARYSSPLSLLTGLVQQGAESFFSTQRILLDLIMRQNSMTLNAVRDALSNRPPLPVGPMAELAGEGVGNFIAAQRVLLNLALRENEIVMTGVRERVSGQAALALTGLVRRSVDTFIDMQQHFLTLASRQTDAWVESAKAGTMYNIANVVEFARDGMETFVRSQKKLLDGVAEEVANATDPDGYPNGEEHERTELTELARQASETFFDAQKKLLDVAGQQVDVGFKAARTTMDAIGPMPKVDIGQLTRETVESFVAAQKALLDVMVKPRRPLREREAGPAEPVRKRIRKPKKVAAEA